MKKTMNEKMGKMLMAAALCMAASTAPAEAALPGTIDCEGLYRGHLQGVATDGRSIYWSFTCTIVRTDMSGRKLASVEAPRHQGDLCVKGSVVYVAVNLGRFNQANSAVSMVMSYDAETLGHLRSWRIDMPHGAGGMTWKGDHFYVVGGLPATHERNYVYEYDGDFRLVERHELATGFTLMGIQTAAFEDGRFLFGIYGCPGTPSGVLTCPPDLSSFERWTDSGKVGIVKIGGAYYTGATRSVDGSGPVNAGSLVRSDGYPCARYRPEATGKGRLVVFFEGRDRGGWTDCGYSLSDDGYRPLCAGRAITAFVKAADAGSVAELPAVGIGGRRSYSAPDLVRALRRAAEQDEVLALHVPGVPEDVRDDIVLESTLDAVHAEAKRLKMGIEGL